MLGHRLRRWPNIEPTMAHCLVLHRQRISAVRSQKVVSAYFTSEQILPFGYARQIYLLKVPVVHHVHGRKFTVGFNYFNHTMHRLHVILYIALLYIVKSQHIMWNFSYNAPRFHTCVEGKIIDDDQIVWVLFSCGFVCGCSDFFQVTHSFLAILWRLTAQWYIKQWE